MAYIALIDEQEVEFSDVAEVADALRSGELTLETWIKDAGTEADWESVEEMFPQLAI